MTRRKRQVKRMADISKEIQDFREAVYGEEVRGSMISLAEKVNGEVEDNTDKVTKYGEAEDSRVQAEAARVNAEKARVTAENGRASAEESRVYAESTRVGNEEDRISAEEDRAEAELARTNAESTRVSAESERATSELERETAESERETSESGRKTSEQGRVSAETDRVSAENARAEAETNRQANTEQAINDCDEATARANAAAEAAEGLVLGDISEKTVTFETALQRANIQSGDSLAVAFGKLAKFCADLDSHAFSAPVNNLTGTDPSLPLAAPQGATLKKEVDKLNSALVLTGWHDIGAATLPEAVYLAHIQLLKDRNNAHMIGSRYAQNRGRYIVMNRTSNNVYHFRVSDTGMVYAQLKADEEQVYTP